MNDEVEAVLRTLPRKIKVGAYDWRIKIEEGEAETCGLMDSEKSVIHVWPEMHPSPEHVVGTVIHELLHIIYDDEVLADCEVEERVVTGFEVGLIALFRDNPKLLTWIKRGLKKT